MTERVEKPTIKPLERGDWYRRLHAPYTVCYQQVETGKYAESQPSPHLESAVKAVVTMPQFPTPGWRISIIDVDGWIAFGYSADAAFVDAYGHPAWWGSEIGFAICESLNLIDPTELAMMESVARDLSDGREWWGNDPND